MLSRGNSEFEIRNRSLILKNEDKSENKPGRSTALQTNRSADTLSKKSASEDKLELKREVGLFSAVNLIVGVMIGSGIFVSPSMALQRAGSVGLCLTIWAICGMISLLGALCFAELGLVVPRSGAEYAYFLEAYGGLHKFWGPLPSFICSWVYVMVLRPSEVAIIILTFSEYICRPLEFYMGQIPEESRDWVKRLIAISALSLLTYINYASVKLFVRIQNIFTITKLMVCIIIVLGGVYELCAGNTKNISRGFDGTNLSVRDISLAFYSCLWPYDGWSTVTSVTEEVKNPEKNILRSIVIAVPLVTTVYFLTNVAYMTVLTHAEMLASSAVAVSFGERILGVMSFIMPLGVAISTFGCALSIQFSVTRLCYVSGRQGHMMEVFSYINIHRLTPAPAVILQGLLSLTFILAGNIAELIDFASFLIWMFYGVAMVALMILRRSKKDVERPFKVQLWVPIFIILVALFLCLLPIITDPSPWYFIALGLIGIGVIVYIPFVFLNLRPNWLISKFTYLIQVLMQVVPAEQQPD
ncbi:b(0,+)-type amino acid transporter 1 [Blattella germanica]|nr:b(0,+)-type amino acid transporter 1 [Blattella germanica]